MTSRLKAMALVSAWTATMWWSPTHAVPADRHDDFESELRAFVADTLTQLPMVPGFAVTVVKGDRVLVADGFGFLDAAKTRASHPDAAYYVASSTKSFTALAASRLEDQGRLAWNKPLSAWFPDTTFAAGVAAKDITLQHLLTHTSGLTNDALTVRLAYTGEHDPALLRRLLAQSAPNPEAPIGRFDYDNVGYNIATIMMEDATGSAWQDLLGELVFEPLGMHRTTAYWSKGHDLAPPHMANSRGAQALAMGKTDATMHSAGGVVSTARDMGAWLRVQLNDGRLGERRIFPAGRVAATHESRVEVGQQFGDYSRDGYGLGWYVGQYRGQPMLHHFGSFPGYRAHVSLLPEQHMGVSVLVNESTAGFLVADIVANFAYDWWRDAADANTRHRAKVRALAAMAVKKLAEEDAKRDERLKQPGSLSQSPRHYAGTYHHAGYGDLVVSARGRAIDVRLGQLHARAEPHDTPESIRVELIPGQGEVLTFQRAPSGDVVRVRFWDSDFTR